MAGVMRSLRGRCAGNAIAEPLLLLLLLETAFQQEKFE
jgi:hypothetical protein